MTAPLLELTNAVVVLGGTRALDGLTLTIPLGEHTAILGPNGAGKSTFMKLLMLEQRPLVREDGRAPVRVFGQERWDVFTLRSQLGIVSADWHERFVRGNANGAVTGLDAVVSGFFATLGTFGYQRVRKPCGGSRMTRSNASMPAGSPLLRSTPCLPAKRGAC